MGQFSWTYLDDFGNQYKLGLYHGEKSGHVLLYCNRKIILVDFNVLQSKKYNLFLGEELCELSMDKGDEGFSYGLIPDNTADTRLNRFRKKQDRHYSILCVAIAILLLLTIFLSTYYLS